MFELLPFFIRRMIRQHMPQGPQMQLSCILLQHISQTWRHIGETAFTVGFPQPVACIALEIIQQQADHFVLAFDFNFGSGTPPKIHVTVQRHAHQHQTINHTQQHRQILVAVEGLIQRPCQCGRNQTQKHHSTRRHPDQ